MNKKILYLSGIFVLMLLIFGCSGKSGSPVTPDMIDPSSLTGSSLSDSAPLPNNHELWGVWQVVFDPNTGEFDLAGLREADFHLNITKILQPPMPSGLNLYLNSFDLPTGFIDVDIAITHPFPNTDYRTFDTKLILMGMGDIVTSGLDPGLTYPAHNGFRLLNADGYTRWWNAGEFTTQGFFGFYPSVIGTQPWTGSATINGYKYFADPLQPDDPVVPKVKLVNRGTFSTTPAGSPKLQRNFQIQFPIDSGSGKPIWMFQLAVDVCWDVPTGSSLPPKPITDFPMTANCPEAFDIEVTTNGSTAYYDNGQAGGDLTLQIEVFDWKAASSTQGIDGEISEIKVESETLFDAIYNVEVVSTPGSQLVSGIYTITIPDVHPTGLEDQEIVVMIASSNPSTYAGPGPAFTYPASAKLAAYKIVEVPISDTPPILDTITVVVPNGGEYWEPASSQEISWTSTGNIGPDVRIGYTLSGGPFQQIEASTPNDGSYIWDPVSNISSEEVKVIVRSASNPAIEDESDNYFTIMEIVLPEIMVTIPNGGEIWTSGDAEEITWDSIGPVSAMVSIGYTVSGGPVTEIVASTDNDGSYYWDPIPVIDSDEVKIVVADFDNPGVQDESDDYFTVQTVPQIIVTVPNGGEIWVVGDTEEVTWDSVGAVGDFVMIQYSISDTTPVQIEMITDNDGSYMWDPIPNEDSSEVRIIINDTANPLTVDESDEYFTIQPTPPEPEIIVTSPNGGEVWYSGGTGEITWDSIGAVGEFVSINFKLSDGSPIGITPSTENDGSFMWDPLPSINNDEVRVQIVDNSNPLVRDDSDGYFTIEPEPATITVITPNGGEEWVIGESHQIEWTSYLLTGQVKIEYTLFDGDTPVEIATAVDDTGTFIWDPIPGPETDTARVIITSIDTPAVSDQSDDYFRIWDGVAETLTLTSPNGGESLDAGSTWDILWSWTGAITNVNLLLSTDSGATYPTTIAASTECNGTFPWDPIPDLDTDTARIKVEWDTDTLIFDESNADFSILSGTPHGWLPVTGITGVAFTDPKPFQDDQPADLGIWSAGADQSRCEYTDQNDDVWYTRNNDYTADIAGTWSWMLASDSVHKFDVLPDGSWAFVTDAESAAWNSPWLKDPKSCVYSSHEVDGTGYSFVFTGDQGNQGTGTQDPDAAPWLQAVDFDCGVPDGISDDRAYMLHVFCPGSPVAHDGTIQLVAWDGPDYLNTDVSGWPFSISTQGGDTPLVDDTVPLSMALGVDDNTLVSFGDAEMVPAFWILDSVGVVTCILVKWSDGSFGLIDDQLGTDEFGTKIPVDVTIVNANAFGYSVSTSGDFNWVSVLLDNGNGTWSVGVWECDYILETYSLIDITDPQPGTPLSIDSDGVDFEIHVLADDGGTIKATVFEYVP